MQDDFKRCGNKEMGPGGLKCTCCGPAPGKDRKELRRRARRRLKQELRDSRTKGRGNNHDSGTGI